MTTNAHITGTIGVEVVDLWVVNEQDDYGAFEAGLGVGLTFLAFALMMRIIRMIRGARIGGIGDTR